jgi:hypothetical protein
MNAVRCLKCGSIIVSRYRHDFVWCACQNIFVDGGEDYLRRGGPGIDDNSYEELTELPLSVEDDSRLVEG